jgi:hypothetical protein
MQGAYLKNPEPHPASKRNMTLQIEICWEHIERTLNLLIKSQIKSISLVTSRAWSEFLGRFHPKTLFST